MENYSSQLKLTFFMYKQSGEKYPQRVNSQIERWDKIQPQFTLLNPEKTTKAVELVSLETCWTVTQENFVHIDKEG